MRVIIAVGLLLAACSAPPRPTSSSDVACKKSDTPRLQVAWAFCLVHRTAVSNQVLDEWTPKLEAGATSVARMMVTFFEEGERQGVRHFTDSELTPHLLDQIGNLREPDLVEEAARWLAKGRPRRSIVRMVVERAELMGVLPRSSIKPPLVRCDEFDRLRNSGLGATAALTSCIESVPNAVTIELQPGKYVVDATLHIRKQVHLRTAGMTLATARCATDNHRCAELIADPALAGPLVLVEEGTIGVSVDHIVMNGNRLGRQGSKAGCEHPSRFGPVFVANGVVNLMVSNSVAKNALCSTGIGVSGDARLERNTVIDNGVHDQGGLWADGFTLVLRDSWVTENFVSNNTDVDMIFGACPGCDIQDNSITHANGPRWHEQSSFAALMIHGWPDTSGDYVNADISGNVIDCGARRGCGFGLLLGADPWYQARLVGGHYHHNTVRNAHQGIAISSATGPLWVFENSVGSSGAHLSATCQSKEDERVTTTLFSMSERSRPFVDTSRDRSGVSYVDRDFTGCLLNSWRQKSCSSLGGTPSGRPCLDRLEVGVAFDAPYCCYP